MTPGAGNVPANLAVMLDWGLAAYLPVSLPIYLQPHTLCGALALVGRV